ncbi:MAG TPA: class III extradiol ring-cleavage dioxygenase [Novosphingobium sp.]|jgi:4,5-DOPA dioxygenase extradiol|nr:class III extradiol ring-cleavage dioxygenase [Novosphingobium sp.]
MTALRQNVLFVGHGSPMTAITENPERRYLAALGEKLARPAAILCITAHWETRGRTHVTATGEPRTIHDFRGFPQELFDWRYPAVSPHWLVDRVTELAGTGRVVADGDWGYDHGVWGVLDLLFPGAHLPTVAMSLDRSLSVAQHLELGRALAPLRDEGVMIVGSGNVIHNLALWRQSMGTRPEWAEAFRERINVAMLAGDVATLLRLDAEDEVVARSVNSAEHYLPLLYVAGARLPGDEVSIFNDTLDGALSMTGYLIGDTATLAVLQ